MKKKTAKSSAKRPAEGAVSLSLRPEIERVLDAWQELEGDDDNCVIKRDLPYSSNPTRGAARMLEELADLGLPRPAMARLEGVRPGLVALLKKTSLDDLDAEALLDWLTKEAGLHFVDDSAKPRGDVSVGLVEPYSPERSFAAGARLSHPKFGIGEVVRRLDGKIEIRFDSGVRTLAARN